MREATQGSRWKSSGPVWETLELMVREKVREFVREILEDEVTEFLGGRAKSQRRASVEGEPKGYRNGYGKPRKLTLNAGTVEVSRPRAPGFRESAGSWAAVLRSLKARGLGVPKLLVADGNPGIWAAARQVWPEAGEQRCWNPSSENRNDPSPPGMGPLGRNPRHLIRPWSRPGGPSRQDSDPPNRSIPSEWPGSRRILPAGPEDPPAEAARTPSASPLPLGKSRSLAPAAIVPATHIEEERPS